MFNQVRLVRASEDIVEQIKEAVFSGKLLPGDRLPSERDLVHEFGVSRVTIREAIRTLEASGILRVKVGVNGGAFVAEPSTEHVRESLTMLVKRQKATLQEIAEARRVVEIAIAGMAALRADESDIEAMERALAAYRQAITDNDSGTPPSLEFHAALAKAAKNPVLLPTVESLQFAISDALDGAGMPQEAIQANLELHRAILEAVRRRDSVEARRLIETDLDRFDKVLERILEQGEKT